MAGRALAFSDAEIVRMGREDYVSVAADDWYQRRRQDAEGKFFISVAEQGPRRGVGGATRQGIYCLTADGKLLAYKNAGLSAEVMREVLQAGLRKWRQLPEDERRAGAVTVPEHGPVDPRYSRTAPAGGLILNVHARLLDLTGAGKFTDAVCKVGAGDEASRDHLWLTEAEWRSLMPAQAKSGEQFPVPPRIAERIARFHLVDDTRGEPDFWLREEVRSSEMKLTVEEATAGRVRLRLDGAVMLQAQPKRGERGYDARLLGYLEYDPQKGTMERFDLVAVGEHWGEGAHTGPARPGRTPLGVAFELARGRSPADLIAPQAAREVNEYFSKGR